MHGAIALIAIVTLGCRYHGLAEQDAAPQVGVGFQFPTSLTDEHAGTHTVSIALASPSDDIVTVDIEVSGGSADDGADFSLLTPSVTFAPGETQADVDLAITDDGLEEQDETIELQFGRVTNAVPIHDQHTVTISASFLPRVQFVDTSSQSTEGPQSVSSFMLSMDIASPLPCVVAVGASGSATDGEDYLTPPSQVTIAAQTQTGQVDVTMLDDVYDENDESLQLTLTAQQNCVLAASSTDHTRTIQDDDGPPVVSFDSNASSGNEDAGGVGLSVTVSPMSEKTVTVDYAVTGGTAAGSDYSLPAGTLTFAPRDTNQSITFTPTVDTIDEDDETATVSLSNLGNANPGAQMANTFSIIDDDASPTISWSASSSSNPEDIGSYNLTVTKSAASERTVQFSVTSTNGSAGGGDYSVSSGPYTIAIGSLSTTVQVNITGDNTDETNEDFTLGFSGLVACSAGSPSSYTGTINDDDVGAKWNTAGRNVNEGNGSGSNSYDYDVILDASSTHTITMDIGVSGTANATDGSVSPTSLTFTPGQTTKTVTVTVNKDNTNEPDETFILTLTNPSAYVELKSPTQVTHIINNDD